MNGIRSLLASILVFGLAGPAYAQSTPTPAESWAAIQHAFPPQVNDAYESAGHLYSEATHSLWFIMDSDITMTMKSHDEGGTDYIGNPLESSIYVFMRSGPSDSSLYAEFDRQNLTMSMRAKSSASDGILAGGFPGFSGTVDAGSEATDVTMFFDAAGNVYVPTDDGQYIKANMNAMVASMISTLEYSLEAAMDSQVTEALNAMLSELASLLSLDGMDTMSMAYGDSALLDAIIGVHMHLAYNNGTLSPELRQQLRDALRDAMQSRFASFGSFPLIHFAYVFSPTMVRERGNVREEPTTWQGYGGATKFTVASGDDAGYVMIFDVFDRLVLLKDTDGSTATYSYDSDVTVQLPQNVLSMQDLMNN